MIVTVLYAFLLALLVRGQTCENYGTINGTNCACPNGFGGPTCSQPSCGGTIFQGSQRPLATKLTGSFANLTASGCSCENGWVGTACNVCQSAAACQSAFVAAGVAPANLALALSGSQGNDTMTCNAQARVYASSQMSCQVNVR